MNIKIRKSNLLAGINIVSKAVAVKTTRPILECILIEAKLGKIKLTANNLTLGIETYVEGVILEEGTAAVNAKLFYDIVRNLNDSEVDLITNNDYKMEIKCEKTEFSIPFWDGTDFPEFPFVEKEQSITISQLGLRDIVRQTIFSVSDNENSRMMTGENFQVKDNVLTVTSLDGSRISMRKVDLKGDNSDISAIVPGKTLKDVTRIITGGADDDVTIYFTNSTMLFEFENTRVVSRLIEGEYFKITHMLSMDQSLIVKANRQELMGCISRASLLIQESDRKPIIVKVKNNDIMYIRIDTNRGSFNDYIDIEKEGDEIVIGFNPSFIMDTLSVIDDDKVNIYMKDSKSPCIIKDDEGTFVYIILPININVDAY